MVDIVDNRLEVEDEDDPTLGTDSSSLASTLESSIRDFYWENGRRYHGYKSGQYYFPNDEKELNREDMKHHATRVLLGGGLHITSFDKEPSSALDLGTGTGIWAMEFADEHPDCHVIAIDLSPVQPSYVPPNLEFQIDDFEAEWTFRPESFDFIHVRYLISAVRNWPRLLSQCKTYLVPSIDTGTRLIHSSALKKGGTIEVADMDLRYTSDDASVTDTNNVKSFMEKVTQAASQIGMSLDAAPKYVELLREAGFSDVQERVFKLPMGTWPKDRRLKEAGLFHREQSLEGMEGIAFGLLGRVAGWSQEEVQVFLALVRRDIRNPTIHGYWRSYFVTGRKPSSPPTTR